MDEIIGQYWQLSWIFFNDEKAICNQYVSFPKTLITGKYRNVMITNSWVLDIPVSYTRVNETSAGCLRSIYPSLGMGQLFGDVTMGQWRHN